jgi:hypothetical protein
MKPLEELLVLTHLKQQQNVKIQNKESENCRRKFVGRPSKNSARLYGDICQRINKKMVRIKRSSK